MDELFIMFGAIGGGILTAVVAGVIAAMIEKKKTRSASQKDDGKYFLRDECSLYDLRLYYELACT